jgi:hypothetical protein
MLAVDGLAWLPLGYASKILSSPLKKGANFNRNIGHESMGKVLHALRLTISLVRDDESKAPGTKILIFLSKRVTRLFWIGRTRLS